MVTSRAALLMSSVGMLRPGDQAASILQEAGEDRQQTEIPNEPCGPLGILLLEVLNTPPARLSIHCALRPVNGGFRGFSTSVGGLATPHLPPAPPPAGARGVC